MEITTTTIEEPRARTATINTLATIGFIAILLLGIALAIYGSRYVPAAISRISSAAVSLSQSFVGTDKPAELQVVVSTTTLPIIETPVATTTASSTAAALAAATASLGGTTAGTQTSNTFTTVPTTVVEPYGKPDLTLTVSDVGFLQYDSSDSFVTSLNVPGGKRGAVKFVVTNVGTNYSGTWNFQANIPSSPVFTFTSPTQQSLRPGDRIEYVIGFDQAAGNDIRIITITVDPNNAVDESNESNNVITRAVATN